MTPIHNTSLGSLSLHSGMINGQTDRQTDIQTDRQTNWWDVYSHWGFSALTSGKASGWWKSGFPIPEGFPAQPWSYRENVHNIVFSFTNTHNIFVTVSTKPCKCNCYRFWHFSINHQYYFSCMLWQSAIITLLLHRLVFEWQSI